MSGSCSESIVSLRVDHSDWIIMVGIFPQERLTEHSFRKLLNIESFVSDMNRPKYVKLVYNTSSVHGISNNVEESSRKGKGVQVYLCGDKLHK